jgi:hypothetical protein
MARGDDIKTLPLWRARAVPRESLTVTFVSSNCRIASQEVAFFFVIRSAAFARPAGRWRAESLNASTTADVCNRYLSCRQEWQERVKHDVLNLRGRAV